MCTIPERREDLIQLVKYYHGISEIQGSIIKQLVNGVGPHQPMYIHPHDFDDLLEKAGGDNKLAVKRISNSVVERRGGDELEYRSVRYIRTSLIPARTKNSEPIPTIDILKTIS